MTEQLAIAFAVLAPFAVPFAVAWHTPRHADGSRVLRSHRSFVRDVRSLFGASAY